MPLSDTRFPLGANRDKFIFIGGLSKLNDGDANGCIEDMKTIVKDFPNSRISEMAGMIVNGVNAGKRLRGGRFDLTDVWDRRSLVLNDTGAFIFEKLQKGSTPEQTAEALTGEYDVSLDTASADVKNTVASLIEAGVAEA